MKINWFKINTPHIEDNIIFLLESINMELFIEIVIYFKQGFMCKDCQELYDECYCNYCENCNKIHVFVISLIKTLIGKL